MILITSITQLSVPFSFLPTTTSSLDLYAYGFDNDNEGLNLYTVGSESSTNNIDFYSAGKIRSTGGINLYTIGGYFDIRSSLPLFAEGFSSTVESSIDFYAQVVDIGEDDGGINLFAKAPEGGSLDMFMQGASEELTSSIFFSAEGVYSINSGLNMISGSGQDNSTNSLTLYAVGW